MSVRVNECGAYMAYIHRISVYMYVHVYLVHKVFPVSQHSRVLFDQGEGGTHVAGGPMFLQPISVCEHSVSFSVCISLAVCPP